MPFDPTTPRSRDEVLLQAIVSGDSSAMGDPRDREEEFVKAIADKETLPDYSEASEGDVLQIGADGPEWGESGGNTKYIHNIHAYKSTTLHCVFQIIDDNNTQITSFTDVKNALYSINKRILASGCGHYGGTLIIDNVYCSDNIDIVFSGTKVEFVNNDLKETYNIVMSFSSGVSFTDYITEL